MSDFIDFGLKEAAVALAETLNYERGAERIGVDASELEARIKALECKLCLTIFIGEQGTLSLTDEGRYLIQVFRTALSRHSEGGSGMKNPEDGT